MRRRNNIALLTFLLTTLTFAYSQAGGAPLAAQEPSSAQTSPTTQAQPPAQASPTAAPPASQLPPADAGSKSSTATGQVPQPNGSQNPDSSDSGVFVFKKQVEEVVLHATVVDDKQHIITTLDKGDFNVFENGSPQTITSFRHEDIPVAMGIVSII